MFTLKLYTNWMDKAEEKIHAKINGKWKGQRNISIRDVKKINKLIVQAKAIESTDDYTIYQIE